MFKKTNFNYDKQRQYLRLDFRTLVTSTKRKAVHNPEKAVGTEEMGGKTQTVNNRADKDKRHKDY